MRFKFAYGKAVIVAVLSLQLFLAACATSGGVSTQKMTLEQMQERAAARSSARWKALTDKRFSEAFNYLSEASRVGITQNEYQATMQRMGYLAAGVTGVSCEDTVCTVRVNLTLPVYVRNVGTRPQVIPVEELWTLQNGELWLIRR